MRPALGTSRPATRRRKVVLPDPEGPSSAISSPARTFRSRPAMAAVSPKDLARPSAVIAMATLRLSPESVPSGGGEGGAVVPFEEGRGAQGDEGEACQKRGDGESSDEVVLIIKDLHLERHGVGESADMAGEDRHRAAFAPGAGVHTRDAR